MSESARVREMHVLELIGAVVAREGDPRLLAVTAEAWQQSGMGLQWFIEDVGSALGISRDEAHDLVSASFYNRPRRLLRADARGLRLALRVLDQAGILDDKALEGRYGPRHRDRFNMPIDLHELPGEDECECCGETPIVLIRNGHHLCIFCQNKGCLRVLHGEDVEHGLEPGDSPFTVPEIEEIGRTQRRR